MTGSWGALFALVLKHEKTSNPFRSGQLATRYVFTTRQLLLANLAQLVCWDFEFVELGGAFSRFSVA
uniref:Uncharacterized protein n=1 Tax=Anguilla anguilla TaxID=7936 RepID=A0A0E9VYS7_ANGAN